MAKKEVKTDLWVAHGIFAFVSWLDFFKPR